MAEDLIRYDLLVQDALRDLVRRVLGDAAKFGLPGEHHFEVVFRTHAPGVKVPAWALAEFPDEMKIILQHQFWDLRVDPDHFEVGLAFRGKGEKLSVPFKAVTGFSDPSVEFSLRFEVQAAPETPEAASKSPRPSPAKRPIALPAGISGGATDSAAAAPSSRTRPSLIRSADPVAPEARTNKKPSEKSDSADGDKPESKVVSIDAFRKKP